MNAQARVTSLDALETFRASMIVFGNKAHNAADQVADEIRRTRSWIQHDQRVHWENELRRRSRALAQAEQELLSAKLVGLLDNLSAQQNAVRRTREACEEAEKKLRNVKRWTRDFDSAAEPLAKRIDSFREVLAQTLPRAIAFLLQAQKTLEAYGETSAPTPAARPNPSGDLDDTEIDNGTQAL
ncbi:MAG: hypothetical protein QOD99_2890 [Chthoniobacter sp.]|nr:hypothetical protein [Chthoniobacter sp.]